MTALFNKSLYCGSLPDDFKKAKVTPVYKGKGSKVEPGNYRPISIVPHVAKLFEKRVQSQLMLYLDTFKLINWNQSAFLKGHSTQTAIHKVIDDLLDNVNDGYINGMCLIDLAKCFDTIDHSLLIKKLGQYGICGNAVTWFTDYLSNRSQAVQINNALSDFMPITTGVPQGSVLGPVLFLIFINDLPSCLVHSSNSLYADDTEIHASGKTLLEVQALLQQDLDNLVNWFKKNKLTINVNKSLCMIFSSGLRQGELCLYMDGVRVECVPFTKYLGVYPDANFKWDIHTSNVCKTISPKIAIQVFKAMRGVAPYYISKICSPPRAR
jgi:hypothetical protein